jgi:3-hydroxyacyl-[acyl-carrier-protein] dehydratase
MELLEELDGDYRAAFLFPRSFVGFQGHFPGNPILPGVCMIHSLLVLCQTRQERRLILKEIVSAKFYTGIGPGERIEFSCRERSLEEEDLQIFARVTSRGKRVAELKIVATLQS